MAQMDWSAGHASIMTVAGYAAASRWSSLTEAELRVVRLVVHGLANREIANRLRVATDWFNDIIEHRQFVQFGVIPSEYSGLTAAEHTDIYYQTDGQPLNRQRQGSST